jgi:hypothetical protein
MMSPNFSIASGVTRYFNFGGIRGAWPLTGGGEGAGKTALSWVNIVFCHISFGGIRGGGGMASEGGGANAFLVYIIL